MEQEKSTVTQSTRSCPVANNDTVKTPRSAVAELLKAVGLTESDIRRRRREVIALKFRSL